MCYQQVYKDQVEFIQTRFTIIDQNAVKLQKQKKTKKQLET